MSTVWPHPGSLTVNAGGIHARCKSIICACDCHSDGAAHPAMQRLTLALEMRLEAFVVELEDVAIELLSSSTQRLV
jgi:hypothetical protein